MLMKKNHLFSYSKICTLALLGVSALFLTSCAKDGFDEETFDSGVSNTQVASISAEDIDRSDSPDGKSITISWPVVMGAGGYCVNLIDESNPDEPLINDSIVDGCSVTFKCEEDMNYLMSILALGDKKRNNTDAAEAALYPIPTGLPTYRTIPANSDLNEWFTANPIPAEKIGENLVFNLEGGEAYTISGILDFDGQTVTLRSNSKIDHPTITLTTGDACINFTAGFSAKYIDWDCAARVGAKGVFEFSKNSSVTPANVLDPAVYAWEGPIIFDPITIANCNFYDVKSYFFFDNQQKTACMTFLVDNCVVHMTPETNLGGGVFWTNKGGHINDLTVNNSTFYEPIDNPGDYKYFYQAGMDPGPGMYVKDTPAYAAATNSVNYTNSTFYHVTWNNGQWGNYNGMQSKAYSYWIMTDCIFFDCSTSGSVPRRFLHGRANQPHAVFNNNTYMNADGTFQDPQNYDTSGTNIESDPQFADPANGDFHISGAIQVERQTGDPRWLP